MVERADIVYRRRLIAGPLGLTLLRIDITGTEFKVLPEAALAMVLFTDAAHADLGVVRRTVTLRPRGAVR